jgi:hypothetical protein
VIRPLAAVLTVSFVYFLVPGSQAWCSDDSFAPNSQNKAIFRIHGGTTYSDPQSGSGPGWLAGGAVGLGVARDVYLLFGFDHLAVRRRGLRHDDIGAVTAQFELSKPFQGWIEPRLNMGAGVYVRSIDPGYYTYSSFEYIHGLPYTDAPFGINIGGGASVRLSKTVLFDLDGRYHQTTGIESTKSLLTSITAGLTFAIGKQIPEPDGWVDSGALSYTSIQP